LLGFIDSGTAKMEDNARLKSHAYPSSTFETSTEKTIVTEHFTWAGFIDSFIEESTLHLLRSGYWPGFEPRSIQPKNNLPESRIRL